jgi:hypothetical protein
MLAGTTQHRVGTRIKITSIDSDDADDQVFVGQTGSLTHPFPGLMWPGIENNLGVHLDNGQSVNLTEQDKFDVLEDQDAPAAPVAVHG